MRTHNLFISHSWSHSDAYERLVALLRNRTYVGALIGMILFLGALLTLADSHAHGGLVFCVIGVLGALLAVSRVLVIQSYKQLNDGKFEALLELDKQPSYRFFEREWHFLGHQFFALYVVVVWGWVHQP